MVAGLPKEDYEMKKLRIIGSILLIMVLLTGSSGVISARELAKAELKVRMEIPVMQRLTVLQPAEVSFTYPKNGQAVEFTNVGRVRVQSNANWALTVGAVADASVDIAVRPSGNRLASWQSAQGQGSVYTGPNGSQDMSWDVRVEGRRPSPAGVQGTVHLVFTLGQS